MKLLQNWKPDKPGNPIQVIDMHTAGEPLRVVVAGLPGIRGDTILEKIAYFRKHHDHLRRRLMWEPRGHADMYGAILTEPVTEGADFGVFFLHNEGYSTMCGHAVIALTRLAFETGLVSKPVSEPVIIDAPPGRIISQARLKNGQVNGGAFLNVPSFVLARDRVTEIPGFGRITYDVAYGGAFYALIEADQHGISLQEDQASQLIALGRKIKEKVAAELEIGHPYEEGLSFLYGTIFTGSPEVPGRHSRNVCIFADGELDRSPTGSGLSARAALHHARGEFAPGNTYVVESIIGTTMEVSVDSVTEYGGYSAVVPRVAGEAYFTGRSEFWFDPDDPLNDGFLIR